jgi:heme A synthase
MVSLAVLTSRNGATKLRTEGTEAMSLRRLSLITVGLIYIQTIFGAVLRHTGDRLDAHLLFAGLVTLNVIWLATKILRAGPELDHYRGTAHAMWLLLLVQLGLGTGSFLTKYTVIGDAVTPWVTVILTASHVVGGALLFATAISLTIRLYRNRSWSWKFASSELLSEQASAS